MFSIGLLGRRGRWLRRTTDVPVGLDDLIDLETCSTRYEWGRSLPWVDESRFPGPAGVGRRFVIDCPSLASRGPWFAAIVVADALEVLVVLPDLLPRRGVTRGWASSSSVLDADRRIATVALPTTAMELRALPELVTVGYSPAPATSSSRGVASAAP
jgi:hypothetical protein